ncbi:MAG: hypothetical protein QW117_02675 [Candidatus Pacearchaeota archaeon]
MKKIREVVITSDIDKEEMIYNAITLYNGSRKRIKIKLDPTVYKTKVPKNENIDNYITDYINKTNKRLYQEYDVFVEINRNGKNLEYKLGKILNCNY